MIDFSDRTMANILKEMMARVPNTRDKREGAFIDTAIRPASYTFEEVYSYLSMLQDNSYAIFAKGEYLDYKAFERNITRNPATPALRNGEFDIEVVVGTRFSTIGENTIIYEVVTVPEDNLSPDGYFVQQLECEIVGAIGNDYAGQILPLTYINGLRYAVLTDIVNDGTDLEDDDSLRSRYIASLREIPFAGNISAYRQKLLSYPDVGAVQVYPTWQGGGTVKCSIINANFDVASEFLVEQLQADICPLEPSNNLPAEYGLGFAPIGAKVTITTATELLVSVSLNVTLKSSYVIADVQTAVQDIIQEYFLEVRRNWGKEVTDVNIEYPLYIYSAQIGARVLAVQEIVNITQVLLNGVSGDLSLIESAVNGQQLPYAGNITVTAN